MAATHNTSAIKRAKLDVLFLTSAVAMQNAVLRAKRGEVTTAPEPRALAHWETGKRLAAVWSSPSTDFSTSLSRTRLDGVETVDTASYYSAQVYSGDFVKQFMFMSLGNTVVDAGVRSTVDGDPLLEQAYQLIQGDIGTVAVLLSGLVTDRNRVNNALNDIWLKHHGTSIEEEVGILTDQVRDRTETTVVSMEMEIGTNLLNPTQEELEGLRYLLGILQ